MRRQKLVLRGVAAALSVLALASIGLALAQTGADGHHSGGEAGGGMGEGDTMPHMTAGGSGDHGGMVARMAGIDMDDHDIMGQAAGRHAEMLQAIADAFGISTADLQSQLDQGKTVAGDRGRARGRTWRRPRSDADCPPRWA